MKRDDDAPPRDRELSEVLGVDAERLAERLSFYEIAPRDEELLAQISELCDPRLDELIADFYAHLLRFPELETLLRATPGRVPHLQEMQKEYFRRLTRGQLDADCAESRLRHSGSAEILLSARAHADADVFVLRVTDRGAGFRPEDLPHVFEKFRSVPRSPTAEPRSDQLLAQPAAKARLKEPAPRRAGSGTTSTGCGA